MGASENAALIRRYWQLLAEGHIESAYATWAEDAVWHVLDATRFQGDYTRDEYFTMLATTWAEYVTSYAFEIESCEPFGDELVVAYLRGTGETLDGPIDPNGGLMIYRVLNGGITEGWALSRGRDATAPF